MVPRDSTSYAESSAFRLSQIGARVAQMFAGRLAPLGVSPRAFGVLSNIAAGDPQTQQQLADALGMHRNNMVGLIDEMEAAGLVQRSRSSADRRAFEIRPTAAGHALVSEADTLIAALEAELTRGLGAAERQQLGALLKHLAGNLDLHAGVHPHLSARAG